MGEPIVNGQPASSEFLNHLASYPLVSSSIATVRDSRIGAASLGLAGMGYTGVRPVLNLLSAPYSLVSPYVNLADHLGDEGLNRFDQGYQYSRQLAMDGKEYVQETYEVRRDESPGFAARPKALANTCLDLYLDSWRLLAQAYVTFVDERRRAVRANDGNVTETTVNGHAESEATVNGKAENGAAASGSAKDDPQN